MDVTFGFQKQHQTEIALTLHFFLMSNRGQLLWIQKEVWLYRSPWKKYLTADVIYNLSKHALKLSVSCLI